MARRFGWQGLGAAALLGLLAGLSGCGRKEAGNPDTSGAPAMPASPSAAFERLPDGFAFMRYAIDEKAASPTLCLSFSQALDPATDYSAYVDAGARQLALTVDGQRLCLGGVAFGEEIALTLRAGFPAADGSKLAADQSLNLGFDDRPGLIQFAGDGVILPRIDADGLAIETVNIDEIEIRVRRVNDRALVFDQISAGSAAAAGSYDYEYSDPGEKGTEVFSGRMTTRGPTNALVTSVFPIEKSLGVLKPGAYYVELADAAATDRDEYLPTRAARWIVVTDLAITAYRATDSLDLTVRSLQTAGPLAGVDVQLLGRSNEILGTARSDAAGHVRFAGPLLAGTGGAAPHLLTAYGPNGDFAALELTRAPVDLSTQPITGRDKPEGGDGFVWLDRGIYRPGEDIKASFQLRDAAGVAITDRSGTLILRKPSGLEASRQRFERLGAAGGATALFALPKAAPRGQWQLTLEVDGMGAVASTSLAVEDFVPQRLAVDVTSANPAPLRADETRALAARARFLYGAPGASLPVTGTARISVDPSPFDNWAGYRFGRHSEEFAEEELTLPPTVTDGAGDAKLPLALAGRAQDATQPLRVQAVIRVEEPGGRAVAEDLRLPYRPRAVYFGLKSGNPDGIGEGAAATYEVIAVNADGKAVGGRANWRLYRQDYDYDWYRSEGGSWEWRRSSRIVPIETGTLNLADGKPFTIATRELDWGDYVLEIMQGDDVVASAGFWAGWYGATVDGVAAPDEVRIAVPETPPKVGSTVRLAVRAPYAGMAEVVVATDRILLTRQMNLPAGGAELSLPVTDSWGAGAYVMVTAYTPRDRQSRPQPRRAVGVAYVPVDMATRTYEVTLGVPKVARPNTKLKVDLTAQGGPGKETVYATIAAVDEGILRLTRHASPQPQDWFFGKPALELALYDDYGRLLDPNRGAAGAVRPGGDQLGGAGLSVVPTQTVALFSGMVELGRDGRRTIELDLPDFNGELRLMAVVWSTTATGAADTPLTVRDPVPAELALPRFLAPGDRAFATASLDNIEGAAGTYTVNVAAKGAVSASADAVQLDLPRGTRKDQPIALTAASAGTATLELHVAGPERFAATSTYPIEVRAAHWPERRVVRRELKPGEGIDIDPNSLSGFAPGTGRLDLTLAATPLDTAALFQSLQNYPYQCTEQTVSRAMPLLYARQLSSLAGKDGPDKARLQIRQAIETILARQSGDGAFGLWRVGDVGASPWLGAYTADFLTRARAAGYAVPDEAMNRALAALQPVAQGQIYSAYGYNSDPGDPSWTSDNAERLLHRSATYALYVLARNGKADRSRLRYMHDEQLAAIESPLARAHLGAALAALGDESRARSAFKAAVKAIGFDNPGDWYASPRRDLAGVLALAAEAGQTEIVRELTTRVLRDVPEPELLSTQEKAFLIMASASIAGTTSEVRAALNGRELAGGTVSFTDAQIGKAGRLVNGGKTTLWLTQIARGSSLAAPAASAEDLSISKQITTLAGAPVNLGAVAQGDRLMITLRLNPARDATRSYVIADLLPAGFEIETLLRPEDGAPSGPYGFAGYISYADVMEARDDRFVAAVSARASDPKTFAYIVRAVTPGTFTVPGAVAEDMYRPDVFARSAAGQLNITP